MQKWEYKIEYLPEQGLMLAKIEKLNSLGSEGWELCCNESPFNLTYENFYIFKRRIEEKCS